MLKVIVALDDVDNSPVISIPFDIHVDLPAGNIRVHACMRARIRAQLRSPPPKAGQSSDLKKVALFVR